MNQAIYKQVLPFFFLMISTQIFGQTHFYVANRDGNNVLKYTMEGQFVKEFVRSNSGGLSSPQEILFHPEDGSMLVTGFNNAKIKRYNGETGSFLGDFSSGYNLSSPTKMIIGSDNLLYVTQWGRTQNKIVRFDLDGNFVDEWSSVNVPEGCGMAWDREGNLYVTTWSNGQDNGTAGFVRKFDAQGNNLGIIVSTSSVLGPVGIWIDENGDLFVIDWTFGGVKQFSSSGVFKGNFIRGMRRTEGNAKGPDGKYYLCDWELGRVNRYNADGSFDKTLVRTGLTIPNGLAFEPEAIVSSNDKLNIVSENLKTYPNPTSDELHLELNTQDNHPITLQVYDLQGKQVMKTELKDPLNNNILTLNISKLYPGTYHLNLSQNNKLWKGTFQKI